MRLLFENVGGSRKIRSYTRRSATASSSQAMQSARISSCSRPANPFTARFC